MEDWKKKLVRLASLVGTDAKNPEEKLLSYVESLLEQQRKEIRSQLREKAELSNKGMVVSTLHVDSLLSTPLEKK